MTRRVIGLDVGTYSVKVAHLEARTRATEFDVTAYAELPLSSFEKEGTEQSERDLQLEALLLLKSQGFLDSSWLATGLSGADAQIRSLGVPFNNPKKIEAVLGGLLDSHLPFSIEHLVYSWFSVPKGDQATVLVAFSKREAVGELLGYFRKAEIDPRYLTLKSAALYDLLVHVGPQSSTEGLSLIADIGHKSTSICVADAKQMLLARSFARGGFHVTQSLAQKQGISFGEAEKQKLASQVFSEALQEGYYPIARELRQSLLAAEAQSNQKVERIFLVGGGARAQGLEQFLSDLLQVSVSFVNRFAHFHYAPLREGHPKSMKAPSTEGALALSYAVFCESKAKKEPRFNFRKDEFAYSGEFNFMRQRTKTLSIWAAVIVGLLIVFGGTRSMLSSMLLSDLHAKEQVLCSSILGQKVDSAGRCLSMMQEVISGQNNFGVPATSALDVYLELAKIIGPDIKLRITDLSVNGAKVRFSAESSTFDTIDQVVAALNQSRCMTKVEKNQARQGPNGLVQFQINFDVDCQKGPENAALSLLQGPKEKEDG